MSSTAADTAPADRQQTPSDTPRCSEQPHDDTD